jgi:vacuolar-type H+-ATPase subunit H
MAKLSAPERVGNDPAEKAIATVLGAERDARASIERAQAEAEQIAEAARGAARAQTERTERRIRSVVGAFERELAVRIAEIDAAAAAIARPHELGDAELAALGRAVDALARSLTGVRP